MATTTGTSSTLQDTPSVVLYYKYFVPRPSVLKRYPESSVEALYRHQQELCTRFNLTGRVLLALEGINGTLYARNSQDLTEYIAAMESFDLAKDCASFLDETVSIEDHIYSGIDWKRSSGSCTEPFPDLKISIVKEIVSTGGAIDVEELSTLGGKHLTPAEFHKALTEGDEDTVIVDVRNTFEYEIGHFINPNTNEAALNPEMVVFSNFDSTFCAKKAKELKDKKTLLYCTGGIRCEKASAMLRKRGVDNVCQLQGGIHRYLEEFGDKGLFRGKNFVFDQRVSASPSSSSSTVLGKCIECETPYDEISGSRLCTVCRDLVLVCPECQANLREFHCRRHSEWKHCYFTFVEVFDAEELATQKKQLEEIRESLSPPGEYRNVRRTLMRQITKIDNRLALLASGEVKVDRDAPRRCRTCMKPNTECDGRCWGFWKQAEGRDLRKRKSCGGPEGQDAAANTTDSTV